MRSFVLAAICAALTSSCALVLDFDTGERADGDTTSDGGSGAAGGSGGSGGEPLPTAAWLSSLRPEPAGTAVSLQSMVVAGDTTWVGGYVVGEQLVFVGPDGAEEKLVDGELAITTFVLGLDADGNRTGFFPLTVSAFLEDQADEWAGAQVIADAEGNLYVASTFRSGSTVLLDEEIPSELFAWNLLLAKVSPGGGVTWASHCVGQHEEVEPPAILGTNISAARASFAEIDSRILFGTTVGPLGEVVCKNVAGSAGAGECTAPQLFEAQSGLIWSLDSDTGACDADVIQVRSDGAGQDASRTLWLDAIAKGPDSDMVVVGRVSFSDGSIEPWGADAPGEIAFGFAGRLNVDGTGDPSALTFLENGNSGFVSADGGRLAGRALNDAEALDVRLFDPRGAPIELGDPSDASSDEVVTSASVNGNAMLVTGWMTEDAKLAQDLCGPGCQGDLRESDPICAAASPTKDAFWVVIEDGSRQAVGRGFGDCGNQVVKNGVLSETFMTLAFETEGAATIDTLDGASTELSFDAARKGATIARLPRPKPAQPN